MSSGGLRGLQILPSGANPVRGGFDSHTFPPCTIGAGTLSGAARAVRRFAHPAARWRGAAAVAFLVAAVSAASAARAQAPNAAPAGAPARAEHEPTNSAGAAAPVAPAHRRGPSPTGALLRSLVVPGWGQLANRKYVKAAVVAAGEGALLAGMIHEKLQADDARGRASRAVTDDERQDAIRDKERHLARRDNYGWWSLAAVLYSIADAYVDAHLTGYDEEWRLRATLEPGAGARLGLARAY